MQALAVVEHLDVLEGHSPHVVACLKAFAEHAFILETVEPALRDGPAQLDRNSVFLSDFSAGYAAAVSSDGMK